MNPPNLDRFNDRWEPEPKIVCFDCGEVLTETATLLYWDEHPNGDGEPRCLDCKSQLDVMNAPEPKREWHLLSTFFFGGAIGCVALAACQPSKSGYFILAAIGCGNLGLMARICGH